MLDQHPARFGAEVPVTCAQVQNQGAHTQSLNRRRDQRQRHGQDSYHPCGHRDGLLADAYRHHVRCAVSLVRDSRPEQIRVTERVLEQPLPFRAKLLQLLRGRVYFDAKALGGLCSTGIRGDLRVSPGVPALYSARRFTQYRRTGLCEWCEMTVFS